MKNCITRLLAVLLLAGAPVVAAQVQDNVVLHGTVFADIGRTPIPGVSVVLRGAGSFERIVVTDELGAYRFEGMAPGRFSLDVVVHGFKPFVREDLQLSADPPLQLDIYLTLADVQESVVVRSTGEVLSIRSNAPDLSQIVTVRELAELPSSQRSVVKYALFNPHVRQVLATDTDGQQSQRLSINGKSYRHTAYMLDGVINYDWVFANGPYQMVAASAVEDVQIITNHYPAEFGTTTSGVVRVNTQSGSSVLRGEAFTFLTPSGIQAKPALSPRHVPNRRVQWGGLLGGPLLQDRTFFFVNYEGIDQRRGAYIQSPEPGFHIGEGNEVYALGRVDHNLTDNHSLALRGNFYHYRNNNPNDTVSGFTQPSAGRLDRSGSRGVQLTDRLVSGRLVNFVRVNYAWYYPNNNVPLFPPSVGIERPGYSIEGNSGSNYSRGHLINVSDAVALHRGRHQLKTGAELVRIDFRDNLFNEFGTFRFASGPPTPGENPLRYTQVFGRSDDHLQDTTFQAYVSDDIRISSHLSGTFGLRYEYQTLTTSRNRLLPRLGVAWDATKDGKTKVTAGVGAFSETYPLIFHRRHLRGLPDSPVATYTIPFGVEGFPTFPNSLTEPPDPRFQAARRDLRMERDDLRNPYSWQASTGVERNLGNRWALIANVVYNRTTSEFLELDINAPEPFTRTEPGQRRTAAQADPLRPYTTYLGVPVRRVRITGNSDLPTTFSALDLGIRRKYGSGIRMEAHYLLSGSTTYARLDAGEPNEWDDLRAEKGPSDTHQRHRFVATASVDLPYGLRFAQVTMIASGLPVNPLTGTDNNGDTYSVDRPVGFGRNSFRAPMQATTDVNFAKVIAFGAERRAEVRLDVFNLFNKMNYINVDDTYGEGPDPLPTFLSPIAGIRNAEPSRRIQLGVRLTLGR